MGNKKSWADVARSRPLQTITNSLTIAKEKLGAQSLTQAAILVTQADIFLSGSDPGSSGGLLG